MANADPVAYRLALSDIDGTLLASNHALSARTVDAIGAFVRSGGSFALSTGRMPSGVEKIVDTLRVPVHLVCYSGALVLDADGATVASHVMSAPVARRVIDVALGCGVDIAYSFFVGKEWLAPEPAAPNIAHESAIVGAAPEKGDLLCMLDDGVLPNKIFFNCSCDLSGGERIAAVLRSCVPEVGVVHSASGILLEILPLGFDKLTGALELADHLGVEMRETVAFGDDENDVELLRGAGLGVAMANAPEHVRRTAGLVAPSNDEDGVAVTIERIMNGGIR